MKITKPFDPDKLFFTSDTHLCHESIINLAERPFGSVEEMNNFLIDAWNEKVHKDATVIVCGDFALTSKISEIKNLVERLNGTIILVLGNHDYQNSLHRLSISKLFNSRVYDMVQLKVRDSVIPSEIEYSEEFTKIIATHFPLFQWDRKCFHVHGHVHSSLKKKKMPFSPYVYDVGVDNNNYAPISWGELKKVFIEQIEFAKSCGLKVKPGYLINEEQTERIWQ